MEGWFPLARKAYEGEGDDDNARCVRAERPSNGEVLSGTSGRRRSRCPGQFSPTYLASSSGFATRVSPAPRRRPSLLSPPSRASQVILVRQSEIDRAIAAEAATEAEAGEEDVLRRHTHT